MTTAPRRHALGLPGGSIRALLTIMVVGLVCALLWYPPLAAGDEKKVIPIPPYLLYLLFITLIHYFAARGSATRAEGERAPLGLPAGSVRFLVVIGLFVTVGYRMYNDMDGFREQISKSIEQMAKAPLLPIYFLAGFVIGTIVHNIFGRKDPSRIGRDLQAWLALLGCVGMGICAILELIINPSLLIADRPPIEWGNYLSILIAFYFGARS